MCIRDRNIHLKLVRQKKMDKVNTPKMATRKANVQQAVGGMELGSWLPVKYSYERQT